MSQLICRISSKNPDVEILKVDHGKEIWKSVSVDTFVRKIEKYAYKKDKHSKDKPKLVNVEILAISPSQVIYRQPEHRRIVTYAGKAYTINFPNAICHVKYTSEKVTSISMYAYMQYRGIETKLYKFPMPNMTMSENMCIGTADRKINTDVFETVESIVDSQYTHDSVDNLRKKMSTIKWFRYLKNNHLQRSDLQSPICSLKDLVR